MGDGDDDSNDNLKTSEEGGDDRFECIRLLLASGCVPTSKDANKHTMIHAAARAGQARVLSRIVGLFPDAPRPPKDGGAGVGKAEIVNWTDRWKRTALHWAVLNSNVRCVRILVDAGALVTPPVTNRQIGKASTSMKYESPMEIAQRLGKSDIVDILKCKCT